MGRPLPLVNCLLVCILTCFIWGADTSETRRVWKGAFLTQGYECQKVTLSTKKELRYEFTTVPL